MYKKFKNIFDKLLSVGTVEGGDASENQKTRITNAVAYIGVAMFFYYMLTFFSKGWLFIAPNLFTISIYVFILGLNYKGKYRAARLLLCIDLTLITLMFSYLFGKESFSNFFLIPCSVTPLLFFEKNRDIVPLFLFSVLCFPLSLFIFEISEPAAKEIMIGTSARLIAMSNVLLMFLVLFAAVRVFKAEQSRYARIVEARNGQLLQKNEEINLQKEEISSQAESLQVSFSELGHKNKEITSSINYARRIQTAVLPVAAEIAACFSDFFLLFRPRDIVSGDFYWYAEKNNCRILAAADSTGHGVPGAFMSVIGSSLLDKIVKDEQISRPDEILNRLHIAVRTALKQADSDSKDGMDITICCLPAAENCLYFAGAKNPLYYTEAGKMKIIKGDKFPIGGDMREGKRIFTAHQVPIRPESMFFLFSDGFQDQFGGPERRKFMTKRFRDLLEQEAERPAGEQKAVLETALEDWMNTGGEGQTDDILVIGFRP